MRWFAVIIALCPGVVWAADFDALDASQAAWEGYSVAQCRYGGAKWPGGDMGRFDRAICDRDLAARRAIFLWQERQPMPWPDYRGWE